MSVAASSPDVRVITRSVVAVTEEMFSTLNKKKRTIQCFTEQVLDINRSTPILKGNACLLRYLPVVPVPSDQDEDDVLTIDSPSWSFRFDISQDAHDDWTWNEANDPFQIIDIMKKKGFVAKETAIPDEAARMPLLISQLFPNIITSTWVTRVITEGDLEFEFVPLGDKEMAATCTFNPSRYGLSELSMMQEKRVASHLKLALLVYNSAVFRSLYPAGDRDKLLKQVISGHLFDKYDRYLGARRVEEWARKTILNPDSGDSCSEDD